MMCVIIRKKKILRINHKLLKNLNWLEADQRGEVEFGTTDHQSISWQ